MKKNSQKERVIKTVRISNSKIYCSSHLVFILLLDQYRILQRRLLSKNSFGSAKNIPPKAVSVRGKPSVPKVPSKNKIEKKASMKTTGRKDSRDRSKNSTRKGSAVEQKIPQRRHSKNEPSEKLKVKDEVSVKGKEEPLLAPSKQIKDKKPFAMGNKLITISR